jgi:hypothetical protein
MSPEQLYTQIHEATPRNVATKLSGGIGTQRYSANGVREITCFDKDGNEVTFPNSPRVEVKITCNNGKKRYFYFDTILLEDSVFSGCNSRILDTRREVKYADIKKVELQKGAKAYYYSGR